MASVLLSNILCNITPLPVITPSFPKDNLKTIRKPLIGLVKDMCYFKNGSFSGEPDSNLTAAMRKSVLDMYEAYKDVLHKHVDEMLEQISNDFTIERAFSEVVETILEDIDNLHWKRLVMPFVLLSLLASRHTSETNHSTWETYHQILLRIFKQKKIDVWIYNNGGWDGFIQDTNGGKTNLKDFLWFGTIGLWSLSSISI
ncbi:uncharacterized protein LOC115220385 [Argonauta hians]